MCRASRSAHAEERINAMFPRQGIDRFVPLPPARPFVHGQRKTRAASMQRVPQELATLVRLAAVVAAMTAVVLSAGA
jgi:hypothetical protein